MLSKQLWLLSSSSGLLCYLWKTLFYMIFTNKHTTRKYFMAYKVMSSHNIPHSHITIFLWCNFFKADTQWILSWHFYMHTWYLWELPRYCPLLSQTLTCWLLPQSQLPLQILCHIRFHSTTFLFCPLFFLLFSSYEYLSGATMLYL